MERSRLRRVGVVVLLLSVLVIAVCALRRAMFAPPPPRIRYVWFDGRMDPRDRVRDADGGRGYECVVRSWENSGITVTIAPAWQTRLYRMLDYPAWWEPTMWTYCQPPSWTYCAPPSSGERAVEVELQLWEVDRSDQ
jgi:hypothetical protein